MFFSLILATVNRTEEPDRFLNSLTRQSYTDFELIVADQNPDDRLIQILEKYKLVFPILHLRSDKGLSKARNVGIKKANGDVIAFPDDDCWYPDNLLETLANFFNENRDYDGFTGRSISTAGKDTGGRFSKKPCVLNQLNILGRHVSYTVFLRRSLVEKVGDFDIRLGLGANTKWGSGEETDYLLRCIKMGSRLYYDPSFLVYHPEVIYSDSNAKRRALSYSLGWGKVLRKHQFPFWFVLYHLFCPLAGASLEMISLNVNKARYHWCVAKGRIYGWLDF